MRLARPAKQVRGHHVGTHTQHDLHASAHLADTRSQARKAAGRHTANTDARAKFTLLGAQVDSRMGL